ncbi:rhodanese-like domain-containing protein [Castellaniella sp. GW247-6E4]|uniref:rhodanese-like domain-containing protein n=1 Tax=Castellaniella sp. GW247-6E4 TaxID=3140380 RepID=UPI003314D2CB
MDFLLNQNNLWILLIALVSGGMLLWPSLSRGRPGGRIALNDAVQQINREHGQFIDVRPAEQFKAGSIPQSRNVPMADLESHVGSLPKDKPLILVDSHGRDAQRALASLRKHGFDRVSSLDGGLDGWVQAGMPLKKS